MHRRYGRRAVALSLAVVSSGGCVQMTRHSNTMVFGTNTSFGIKVGTDATSTPSITVGYSRQEAVVMPLVANTADNGTVQAPCPQVVVPGTQAGAQLPTYCKLIGKEGGSKEDAYSVLASFGAKYSADAGGSGTGAAGQIAQYFATGLAARKLAENGGASTVALGSAAAANARALASDKMLTAMNTPAAQQHFKIEKEAIAKSRTTIVAKVRATPDFQPLLGKMDQLFGGANYFSPVCVNVSQADACADLLAKTDDLGLNADDWAKATDIALK